jgi:hypothetical protein
MGSFVEGELHLAINAIVSKPIYCHFILFSFSLFILFLCFKKLVGGHCPSLLTRCNNVIHKNFAEMMRLTRDETSFLLVMQPRATTIAWWPDNGNVIPLHVYDHDRLTHDETSYPPTSTLSILLYFCGSPFLIEKHLIIFLGIPGWSISKVHNCILTLSNYFYPLGL